MRLARSVSGAGAYLSAEPSDSAPTAISEPFQVTLPYKRHPSPPSWYQMAPHAVSSSQFVMTPYFNPCYGHASPSWSSRRGCGGWSGYAGAPGRGPARSTGSSSTYRSRAAAGSPACPVQLARSRRVVRVSGCPGPDTRSRTGSRSAYRSRAAAGSPACPVQSARLPRVVRVSGCSGPRTRSSRAAARRTGPRRRPDPPPPQSIWRGCRGWSGCPGAPGRGPACARAAAR